MQAIKTLGIFVSLLLFCGEPCDGQPVDKWYAGTWDSTIYNRAERPRTVAIRIEFLDSGTRIPVSGVKLYFRGTYLENKRYGSGDRVGIPYEPQQREFELPATTSKDGVVVFALNWQKQYPWRHGADDIEKVQRIETRHPRYLHKELPVDFLHLLDVGQSRQGQLQEPEVFERFERGWIREINRPDVKFCVLDLGTKYLDFENKRCVSVAFFEKIRRKDFGTVYRRPHNWFGKGRHPQSECGPYFVYSAVCLLQRLHQADEHIRARTWSHVPGRKTHSIRELKLPASDKGHSPSHQDSSSKPLVSERGGVRRSRKETPPWSVADQNRVGLLRQNEKVLDLGNTDRTGHSVNKDPFGIVIKELDNTERQKLGLPVGVRGIVVADVARNSHADRAGLEPGQVIEHVRHRVVTEREYDRLSAEMQSGDQVLIGILRKDRRGRWERDTVISYTY